MDGFDGAGKRTHAAGVQFNLANGNLAPGDAAFALHALSVGKSGDEVDIRESGRKDAAAYGEDFGRDANGFGKVAGDVGESGKKEIAEIVAAEAAALVETILKQAAEKRFVFRERDHAIANITGRKNAIFAAKTPGATAVVSHGDDCGQIRDWAFQSGTLITATDNVFFQPAK